MVLTAFALLLLSAEPTPSFAVVTTATPGLERVANTAGAMLAERLEADHVELGGYLKTMGPGCQGDLRCLTAAPGLAETTRLLHLRVRPASAGRLVADLRLIDRARRVVVVDRSAAIVEPKELAAWAEQAATRIFTRTSPLAQPSPSRLPEQAPAPASPPQPPPSTRQAPPSVPRSTPPKAQSVRGAGEEP
jgi:hypothetical protein